MTRRSACLMLSWALALFVSQGCADKKSEEPHGAPSGREPAAPESDALRAARGQRIFSRGESATGQPITAVMSAGNVPIDATMLPCTGCHGKDGRGRSEGGVSPSDLRWEALSRPYQVTEGTGRKRPPYTDKLLVRAVTMGLDSGGTRLDPTMPRYRLTQEEAKDLTAYLKSIGKQRDPGLSDTSVRIGVLFPEQDGPRSRGALARSAVRELVDDVNRQNGIFGRKLVLTEAHDAQMLDERPFAVMGVFAGEAGRKVLKRASEEGIVTLGVVEQDTKIPGGGSVFTLFGGLSEEELSPRPLARSPQGSPLVRLTPLRKRYDALVADGHQRGLSEDRYQLALFALSSGDLLIEGLRRAGRDASRERLIAALEGIHDHATDLVPPITFSKTRRAGVEPADGAPVEPKKPPFPVSAQSAP